MNLKYMKFALFELHYRKKVLFHDILIYLYMLLQGTDL